MYCTSCSKNFKSGQFCPECGTTLIAPPNPQQALPPMPVAKRTLKDKKVLLIAGGSALLVIVLVLLGLKLSSDAAIAKEKDELISKAMDDCSISEDDLGVTIYSPRVAEFTDSTYSYMTTSDLGCLMQQVGGPVTSTSIINKNFGTKVLQYGDVQVTVRWANSDNTIEIVVR